MRRHGHKPVAMKGERKMRKINVEKWFEYDESTRLENQVKYFIACSVEDYLNGCHDCNYEPMTKDEWIEYVWKDLVAFAESGMMVNDLEGKHLYYYGKEKTLKLISTFIENYDDVNPYTK